MLLRARHAQKCSSSRGSSRRSSLLQQPLQSHQVLCPTARCAYTSVGPVFRHTCNSSAAGAQQDLQQQSGLVVQPLQQSIHAKAAQHEQGDTSIITAAVAEVAASGASSAASDAQTPGSNVSFDNPDFSSSDASAACNSAASSTAVETSAAIKDAAGTAAARTDAEADAGAVTTPDPSINSSSSSSDPEQRQEQHPKLVFCSFYQQVDEQAMPVQLPPPGCTNEAPEQRPILNKPRYKSPNFLQHFGAPKGGSFNFLSFLGPMDWHGGKYQVPPAALDDFLLPYFNTAFHTKRRLHIAQSYQDQPYKYFQELDFPWELDIQLVLSLIPKVVKIVTEEACAHHGFDQQQPQPVLSMRTPYKVHVNFPAIFTVEASAREVRKRVINRCRGELSGLPPLRLLREEAALQQQVLQARAALRQLPQDVQQALMQQLRGREGPEGRQLLDMLQAAGEESDASAAAAEAAGGTSSVDPSVAPDSSSSSSSSSSNGVEPVAAAAAQQTDGASADVLQQLDWEAVIDAPHGSLRLLGSCKAPWMDADPAWVAEKAYSEVQRVDGVWMRQPLSYAAVQQCSILLDAMELRVFEQSHDFLEAVYQAAGSREQLLAAKRIIRSCTRVAKALESGAGADSDSLLSQMQPQPQQQQPDKPSKRKLTQQAQQQKAAAQEQQQQKKKLEALAKLQAVQASKDAQRSAAAVAAAAPSLSKPAFLRPGVAGDAGTQQLQQQMMLWQQMQEQQQALAREQEQLLVQQQQLLQALQEEDERQQLVASEALQLQQQEEAAADRQAAEAADAQQQHRQQRRQQQQQQKREALAKLQAAAQLRQQQQRAAASTLLAKPGLLRPGGVPQQQQ